MQQSKEEQVKYIQENLKYFRLELKLTNDEIRHCFQNKQWIQFKIAREKKFWIVDTIKFLNEELSRIED